MASRSSHRGDADVGHLAESARDSVRAMIRGGALLLLCVAGCAPHPKATTSASVPSANVMGIALPGAPAGGVFMDFVAYDRSRHRVWVPAGNTGSVDVIDAATAKVTRIEGFPTKEVERNGNKRTVGPSSASVGDGVVYSATAPTRASAPSTPRR